jgi:hypothetical protein
VNLHVTLFSCRDWVSCHCVTMNLLVPLPARGCLNSFKHLSLLSAKFRVVILYYALFYVMFDHILYYFLKYQACTTTQPHCNSYAQCADVRYDAVQVQ